MYRAEAVLKNETGLHARPASIFASQASKYKSEIKILKGDAEYNGKSVMAILTMGASKGDKITIVAEGEDEREAVDALKGLIENNFGE
jgi:phosphocarrier protein